MTGTLPGQHRAKVALGRRFRWSGSKADPTAIALKYVEDAATATRPDKAGTPGAEQHCANCQFAQGTGDWVGCTLFPGKAVAAKGWCVSWTKKA